MALAWATERNESPGSENVSAYRRKIYDLIRTELLIAAAQERKIAPFRLFGRGHEGRLSVDVRFAGVIRGIKLPSVYLPGYGPKNHYPIRVFKRADKALERALGKSPISPYCSSISVRALAPPHQRPARVIRVSGRQTPEELRRRGWARTSTGYEKKVGRIRAQLAEVDAGSTTGHCSISFSPVGDLVRVLERRKADLIKLVG